MHVPVFLVCDNPFLEPQNHLGWKRPLKSLSPTVNLALPSPPLNHVPKCHVYMSFKYLQEWWINHFPGQPVPKPDDPFGEETWRSVQSLRAYWGNLRDLDNRTKSGVAFLCAWQGGHRHKFFYKCLDRAAKGHDRVNSERNTGSKIVWRLDSLH